MNHHYYLKKGFTLIELLVVISIIGVLVAVLIANMVGVRERGADARLKNDLRQFKSALRLFYNDMQRYPVEEEVKIALDQNYIAHPSTSEIYMRNIPPIAGYEQRNNGDGFLTWVILNNLSDGDISASVARCGVATEPPAGAFYMCED